MSESQSKITTLEMECAVADYLNYRSNLIVPNVHWGMGVHECDLFVVTQAGYVWEIEIKVCKYDLIKDSEKWHGHRSTKIKRLYFAIPTYLEPHIEHIPERAGIITVASADDKRAWLRIKTIRQPVDNKFAPQLTNAERYKVARLGALRIWRLKNKLCKGAA